MNQYDCAVVIPSCDSYEDSWGPFFSFFFKYWPDCPYKIYLITETKKIADPRVNTVNLGKDLGWANNMIAALDLIPENNFIYFLEDVFILKKVDTARIVRLFELLKKDGVSCLRLTPTPGPDKPYKHVGELGVIGETAPYRVSTMTAIWDKAAFKRLLVPGENAWQMELDGTKRSHAMKELFLSVWPTDPAIDIFITAIKRGRWQYDALALCRREGVTVVSNRARENYLEYLTRRACGIPLVGGFFRMGRRWYYRKPKTKK